jgi:hypothetical protein
MSTEDNELLASDWNNRVNARRTGNSGGRLGWVKAENLDEDRGVPGAGLPLLLLIRVLEEPGEVRVLARSSRGT